MHNNRSQKVSNQSPIFSELHFYFSSSAFISTDQLMLIDQSTEILFTLFNKFQVLQLELRLMVFPIRITLKVGVL